jgi:hypothetical protein
MKIVTPFAWLGGAAALLIMGLGAHNIGFAFASVFASGVGAGTLFPALKERWSSHTPLKPADDRLEKLEQRLRQTEDELASTTKHLERLKDERDFDLQLRLQKAGTEKIL